MITTRCDLAGFLVVNKPRGSTTNSLIYLLKRHYPGIKAGQGGTLDPIASGVVVIAVGEATKLFSYIDDSFKEYLAQLQFGLTSDTNDSSGSITKVTASMPAMGEIRSAAESFVGTILQVPPIFSAVKIKGKPAYSYARHGRPVVIEPRTVQIEKFDVLWQSRQSERAAIRVVCARGTYIRSIVRDLGNVLGCGAVMTKLVRKSSGQFVLSDAMSHDEFVTLAESGRISERMLSIDSVLLNVPSVILDVELIRKLRSGLKAQLETTAHPTFRGPHKDAVDDLRSSIVVRDHSGRVQLIASIVRGDADAHSTHDGKLITLKPVRVLDRCDI